MDDFMRCLTEQACGNVYKNRKLLNEQNPAFQTDPMGGAPQGGGDPMAGMGGNDMDQGMGMDNMDMPTGDEGMGGGGIQLTGEQVAMLNQDLQGIQQAMQRIQSVLGGEIAPMSGGEDMDMGMDDDMGDMGMEEQPPLPGGGNAVGPPANMMSRYMHRR